jgi:osmotically inducible protein OsmC
MPTNLATAHWEGNLTEGKGTISGRTRAFDLPYSLKSRIENTAATNPEELIGAAHAGCYTMMLTSLLTQAGTPPQSIKSTAKVTQEMIDGAPTITKIELETEATVPGIDAAAFEVAAKNAKENCPVSRALKAVDVQLLSAKLL